MKKHSSPAPDNAPENGQAANLTSSTQEAGKDTPRILCSDVSELPVESQELVKQLLIEGATFEDVVEAVNERGTEDVSLQAVEHFFRSDPGLQQQRIQWTINTLKSLKQAAGNPGSLEADLLDAIILTGLMRVTRQGANFDLRHALLEKLRRDNLHLERQVFNLKAQMSVQEKSYMEARTRAALAKAELIQVQLQKLLQALQGMQKTKKIDAQTLEKIREIYGLIKAPLFVERGTENPAEENSPSEA